MSISNISPITRIASCSQFAVGRVSVLHSIHPSGAVGSRCKGGITRLSRQSFCRVSKWDPWVQKQDGEMVDRETMRRSESVEEKEQSNWISFNLLPMSCFAVFLTNCCNCYVSKAHHIKHSKLQYLWRTLAATESSQHNTAHQP